MCFVTGTAEDPGAEHSPRSESMWPFDCILKSIMYGPFIRSDHTVNHTGLV